MKEQARSNVSTKYTQDDRITEQVNAEIDDFYQLLEAVREMGDIERKRKQDLAGDSASFVPYDTAFLDSMQEEMDSRFTKGEIQALLSLEQEEYVAVIDKVKTLIIGSMKCRRKRSSGRRCYFTDKSADFKSRKQVFRQRPKGWNEYSVKHAAPESAL